MSRAERFEELIEFPARHEFKVIGHRAGLSASLLDVLSALGYRDVLLVERPSAKGRYASLTFHLNVASGDKLDVVYTALEQIPGLRYLF